MQVNQPKKVLIFTYYWPPAGGVAVQRWLKFSKYLPEYGWEPIIITVENGSYPYYDESLLKEISPTLRVYRTKTFEPFELYNLLRGKKGKSIPIVAVSDKSNKSLFQKASEYIRANFFIPDARKGWVPYAVKQAEEILKNEKIDVIVTTGPPHSTHLIGLKLKEKFGVKWLADFRDPWTKIFYNEFLPRTEATKDKDKELETAVLNTADCVIAISNGIKEMLQSRSKQSKVIPNGFDMEVSSFTQSEIRNERFVLGHVGSYVAQLDSEGLWKAIKELSNEVAGFKEKFRLAFTGKVDAVIVEKIQAYSLTGLVDYKNFVEHSKAIKRMYESDLLLLVLANVPDNKYIISGKLFEYLASSTPILGIAATDGDANNILIEAGREPMLDYDDCASIKQTILNYFEEWQANGFVKKAGTERVKKYQRKAITEQLSGLLNEISGS